MCGIANLARQSELERLRTTLTHCDCGGQLRITFDPHVMLCLGCGIRWDMPSMTHFAMTRDKIKELRRAKYSPYLPPEEEPWRAQLSVDLFEERLS